MKSNLGLVVSSVLGLALQAGAQGSQNPFGAVSNDALTGVPSTGSQNPFSGGSDSGAAAPVDSTGSQNPFGGSAGSDAGSDAGSGTDAGSGATQNPFPTPGDGDGGSGTGAGSGAAAGSGGTQNPFPAPGGGDGAGSIGSQNPFPIPGGGGGSTTPPTDCQCPGGNTTPSGPRLDQPGCPATRAVEPTGQALTYASSPVCPTADGQLYQSPDGATFFMQCCSHGSTTVIKTLVTADFGECMDECSRTDHCSSVQFLAHEQSWSEPLHTCTLSKEGGYSSGACGADVHSYAFVIDPPTIESPDSAGVLCSTECPFAHGQLYVSSVGESFHMDCGQRHGTQVIYRDRQPSLKTCIEACGRLLACHSVDYDIHRQICYYGKHQGEPTIDAPGFASAHSMGCVGACSACSGGRCPTDADPAAPPHDNSPFPQDDSLANAIPPESLCPQIHDTIMEVGGARYKMTCGAATGCPLDDGTRYFGAAADQPRTLDGCLQACASTPGCNSINFLETDYMPGGTSRCVLRQCNPTPSLVGNHISGHRL